MRKTARSEDREGGRDRVLTEIAAGAARGVGQILAALSRHGYLGASVTFSVETPTAFSVSGGGRKFRVSVEEVSP